MVKKRFTSNKKYKSQKRNKICKLCSSHTKRYTSSSLSRHINTVHGEGYICDFCHKKYSEKRAHQICLEKEKFFLGIFLDGSRKNNKQSNSISKSQTLKSLSFIFEDNKNYLLCPKIKLGAGHFSNVFYGINKKTIEEIAIKIPKKIQYLTDYKNEAKILKKLEKTNFYPKVLNYTDEEPFEQLEITLMGPTLLELFNFTNGFDRKTIINILFSLLEKIKTLSENSIIHYDIKPENIVWGVFRQSQIININECYFIDYGLSIDLNEKHLKENNNKNWKTGTSRYMSINAHKNIMPNTLADLESLLYTALYLAKIYLPWRYIESTNFTKNQKILECKLNYEIEKYCGKEFHFLSQFYYYFKKIKDENHPLNFDVLFEFLNSAKKEKIDSQLSYKEKYIFIRELKLKLKEFKLSGLNFPKDEKLTKLFQHYPINYTRLYENMVEKNP